VVSDWQFQCRLTAGGDKTLRLPTVLFGRFDGDLNAATQRLHDYRRKHRPDPERPIPVQFNSWYPYLGEPNAAAMLALVPLAKRLGCEAFVVDAGWFRTDDDDSAADWTARTGDWHTSRLRFPNGLREISAACREQVMRFGLWFEPEVIGSLSAIRRNHPEWLHHLHGQPPPLNERAILNLGVPAARRHAFERITRILSRVGIDWMKWDFNADLGAGGWAPGLPESLTGQDPLVAHYEGLYRLQDAIRRWFPDLILEMCASGGGGGWTAKYCRAPMSTGSATSPGRCASSRFILERSWRIPQWSAMTGLSNGLPAELPAMTTTKIPWSSLSIVTCPSGCASRCSAALGSAHRSIAGRRRTLWLPPSTSRSIAASCVR